MTLFHRAAVFTDIHFGKKSDSEQHNLDCVAYIKWFCEQVKTHDCDAIIFMGDWFDNRSRLRVDTIRYSWESIERLLALDRPVYWLIGNHDLFFKAHRGIHSLPYLESELMDYKNLFVINEITEVENVLFCPWLIGNEFTEPSNKDVKYIFGHFELHWFLLNESVPMPDKGGLHMNHFDQPDAVFSGHFHKRQLKVNEHGVPIWYIGNCFPHDFNDVNDMARGCMILEWGNDPEFLDWPDAPNYHRVALSELVNVIEADAMEQHFNKKSVIECRDDIGLEVEDAIAIKDMLSPLLRDLRLRPTKDDGDIEQETEIGDDAQSVDAMIIGHLKKLDTEGSDYDPDLMVNIYERVGTNWLDKVFAQK